MTETILPTGLERVRRYIHDASAAGGMVKLIDLHVVSADFGEACFTAVPGLAHTNPGGSVHGGYITTLLDTALGCAATTTLPPGKMTTTLELKVSFLRRCMPDRGAVTARGVVKHHGSRVVFAEARLCDAADRTLATASSTLLVIDMAPPSLPE